MTRLSPKLESVLAALCERLGPLTKTKAVKLPYLVDVVAMRALGHPITDGTYQTWELGVVTREVYAFMTHTDGNDLLRVEDHGFSEGGRMLSLQDAPPKTLEEDEETVVDLVAREFGRLDAARLGLLTKSLNTHLGESVWGSNQRPELGEDAYARLAPGWFSVFEGLPMLDLSDSSKTKPVGDPRGHLRERLRA